MAFIATGPGADGVAGTLGVVRVAIDPEGIEGEFGIVVRSDLHRRGLASVHGVALSDNVDMHGLARACGFRLQPAMGGSVGMVLALGGAQRMG
jgi:acetyltransferase